MSTNGLEYQDQKRKKYGPAHIDLPKADLSRVIGGKKLSIHRIETAGVKIEKSPVKENFDLRRLEEIKREFNNLVKDENIGRFLDREQLEFCRQHLAVISKCVREITNLKEEPEIEKIRDELKEAAEKFYAEANKLEDDAIAMMKKQEEQSVGSAEKEKKLTEAIDELNKRFEVFFGDFDDSPEKLKEQFGSAKAEGEKVILDESDEDVLKARGEDADKFIESMGLKEKVASLGAGGVEIRMVVAWGLDLDKTKEEIKEEVDEKIAEILSRHGEQNSPSSQKTREILGQIMAERKSADSDKKEDLGENFSLLDQIPALGESGLRLKNAVESLVNAGLTSAEEKKIREKLQKLYNALTALRTKKREYSQLVMDASNMLGVNGPAVVYEKAGGVIVDAFLPLDKNGSVNIEELVVKSLERAGEEIRSNYAALPDSDIADLNAEKEKRKKEGKDGVELKKGELPLNAENFETMFYAVLLVKTFASSRPQANGEEVRRFVVGHLRERKIELSEQQAGSLDKFLVSELDYKYVEQDVDPGASGRTHASKDVSSQTSSAEKLAPDKTAVEEIKFKAKKMGAEVSDKVKKREQAVSDTLSFLTDDGRRVPSKEEFMKGRVANARKRLENDFEIMDKKEIRKIWEEVAESLKNSDMLRADKLHKIWVTEFFK